LYLHSLRLGLTGQAGTFGRKHTLAYGLYRAFGFVNPVFARQTGFSNEDLDLVWKALANMFDIDRSAARGLMAARRLFVFKHSSALGEAPAHRLFESVKVKLKDGVVAPRSFVDYEVSGPDLASLPPGVELLNIPAFADLA
jgi:CRISPR-associated protein Csd2